MNTYIKSIDVDTDLIVLSNKFVFSKTENFLIETKHILRVDFFASKISESIVKNFEIIEPYMKENQFFKVETEDKAFAFLIKIKKNNDTHQANEIIFAKFLNNGSGIRQNDTRIKNYLTKNKKFKINIFSSASLDENFQKLYRLFDTSGINFPLLSNQQLELIKIADKNVIVQGVAGSGKTNVCIEKLVWCALKNYGGRVLYTTFSRGLLTDTKLKIEAFKQNLIDFLQKLKEEKVMFLSEDKKTAIENYLGVFLFANDEDIVNKLEKIIYFFENNVDYFLVADLYSKYYQQKQFTDESHFSRVYLPNIKNYNIENQLSKLKNLSNEILYKEIFGIVFGFCKDDRRITQEEFIELRKDSFSKQECQTIFNLAKDYENFLYEENLTNNNLACWDMLKDIKRITRYSLIIADEVQDFSQITLKLFKEISIKLFCAGDALQMINPSYFSFNFLKNLLYEEDIAKVAELKNNYRNTKKIQEIIDELEKINVSTFGTHNFVTTGVGVETGAKTRAVFCEDFDTIQDVAKNKFDTFTIVVATEQKKKELREILKNQEILTVAEIKGLERDSVLLYNLLSDNYEKWQHLAKMILNRKTADENSVFRYYFNLFYVGLSRAKHNLFILEDKNLEMFSNFFENEFEIKTKQNFVETLLNTVGKIEFTQQEYLDRISDFIKLEQYENARFAADKIVDDLVRKKQLTTIDIFEQSVSKGNYREAGIKFWQAGLLDEAKTQFTLSNDKILIDFMNAVSGQDQSSLNYQIIKYFVDMKDNDVAKNFILETIKNDLDLSKKAQRDINSKFKNLRGNKNGK